MLTLIFLSTIWNLNIISEEIRGKVIQSYIDTIIADGELSPEEEQELETASNSLKVDIHFDENTRQVREKLRRVWQINHGELPILVPDIMLPKNEICYFIQYVDWYEYRKVRSNVRYAGPTYRLKITKGLYYRVGNLGVKVQSKDERVKIDSGKVYITTRRVLFAGNNKNTSIQFSHIINVQPYKDGVEIIKDSGKSPFLAFDENIHEFTAILIRMIASN